MSEITEAYKQHRSSG